MRLRIAGDERVPFLFRLRAAFDGRAEMCERLGGQVKLLVLGPPERALGFPDGLRAGRVRVRFARARGGHAQGALGRTRRGGG